MELRHLRYFVAVAETRSLKLAAEGKLHITQPSLSRQIRDLEDEVGAPLLLRGPRGVELTPAGQTFLVHARAVLLQAETALHSARQAANPARPSFAMGFMIGHDATWLPESLRLLRDELPGLHVVISTQNSPQLATAVCQGRIDMAFMRREDGNSELEFKHLVDEPLHVFLPKNHPFAMQPAIGVRQLAEETFLSVSGSALGSSGRQPALRRVVDKYLKENGIDIRPSHEVDNLGSMMSLITSTGGVALLPAYAKVFLPEAVITRPLQGSAPTIDLSLGYLRANTSPTLQLFLERTAQLVPRVAH